MGMLIALWAVISIVVVVLVIAGNRPAIRKEKDK